MRKELAYIVAVIMNLLLIGCVSTSSNNNDLSVEDFEPHYKQDVHFSAGKKAVESDGVIYYYSSEGGNAGIYSMLVDGTGTILRISTSNIRKLQIVGDDIYYLAYSHAETNPNGNYMSFSLYRYNMIDNTITNMMNQAPYRNIHSDYRNLGDFYITDSGMIVNACIQWRAPKYLPSLWLYCVDKDGEVFNNACKTIIKPTDLSVFTEYEETRWTLSRLKEILISGEFLPDTYQDDYLDATKGSRDYVNRYLLSQPTFSVTDKKKELVVLKTEAPFSNAVGGTENRVVQSFSSHGIITTAGGQILIFHDDFEDVHEIIKNRVELVNLPDQDRILLVHNSNNKLYIISEHEHGQQHAFMLDMDAGKLAELYSCANGEKILGFDSRRMITAQNKEIKIWKVSNTSLEIMRRITVENKIVQDGNEAEIAGDWLFVYRSGNSTESDVLLEKVNIGLNDRILE